MRITNIEINNFRGIRHCKVSFPVDSRIVCLIGAGDSGKTTLINAIEWALWPSWNLVATDTDFYNSDISNPIQISVSITEIPSTLIKEDKFGLYLRDFNKSLTSNEDDEPVDGGIEILTIRLTIDDSLEPKWEVVTSRRDPKSISQKDRRLLSFGVVGFDNEKDFQWGRSSILQKYVESSDILHNAFTQAMRAAVENTNLDKLDEMASKMKIVGEKYGVGFNGEIHNRLLMQNGSYSTAVGVFDANVPFKQRGLGSRRLLSIGMNVNAYDEGTVVLVDEIETGLEPYRITALINQFREQFKNSGQLIMTTHSRSVVCECSVNELHTITSVNKELFVQSFNQITDIKADIQGLIRQDPDCFLCRRIIVCEGKTEIGFLRSFDSHLLKTKGIRLAHYGVGTAYGGGGDKLFKLARLLRKCGYTVSILMDSDVDAEESLKEEVISEGINVFSWESGFSIEEQIFHDFPTQTAERLIQIAVEEKSFNHVNGKLQSRFKEKNNIYHTDGETIKLQENISVSDRKAIGTIAKNKKSGWYKRIDLGQRIGDVILEEYEKLGDCGFKKTMTELLEWVTEYEG